MELNCRIFVGTLTTPIMLWLFPRKWFLVSFFMSVFWIAVLSFGMVSLVGRTGCILNVDTYIMGLVVVAIGTSIPVSIHPHLGWLNVKQQ